MADTPTISTDKNEADAKGKENTPSNKQQTAAAKKPAPKTNDAKTPESAAAAPPAGGQTKPEAKKPPPKKNAAKPASGGQDNASKERMDQLLTLWTDFQQAAKTHSERVTEIEQRLITAEKSVDYFGKFCGDYQMLWKVKDFRRCYEDAISEVKTVVHSPMFDTHRNGYKIQLSICPNGDGKGKGLAMSIFFTIMKGPSDAMLKWPFSCPVTITLVDQVADRTKSPAKDITKTFSPNPRPENEPFLGRPADTRNMSLGFPKFIALTDMFEGSYIKEDSLFIKVQVDISGI